MTIPQPTNLQTLETIQRQTNTQTNPGHTLTHTTINHGTTRYTGGSQLTITNGATLNLQGATLKLAPHTIPPEALTQQTTHTTNQTGQQTTYHTWTNNTWTPNATLTLHAPQWAKTAHITCTYSGHWNYPNPNQTKKPIKTATARITTNNTQLHQTHTYTTHTNQGQTTAFQATFTTQQKPQNQQITLQLQTNLTHTNQTGQTPNQLTYQINTHTTWTN